MVLLQAKSTQKAPMALELGADQGKDSKDTKKNFSFLQLLQGFDLGDAQAKQTAVEPAQTQSKTKVQETFQTLLQNNDTLQDAQLLNPKIVGSMDKAELSALISKAKEFLKSQIQQSPEYQKSQIKELPQTLRSLVDLAQKFGLDISKISVQTQDSKTQIQIQSTQENPKVQTPTEQKAHNKEISQEVAQTKPETKEAPKQALLKNEAPKQEIFKDENMKSEIPKQEIKLEQKAENKQVSEPLFKAQAASATTTQELVQFKQIHTKNDTKDLKTDSKIKDALASLLRQDKQSTEGTKLTTDVLATTTKEMATTMQTSATQSTTSSLESLLRDSGESVTKTSETTSKIEMQTPLKAESLEVKVNEAKQMIKYLSQDVKNAIEDYKSPFTRVKLQLNPQRLGEIDLTVVQRGNNLHVNMSSNNVAINTLAMNMNELRAQLNNSGINNATFNFNSNSESFNGSADQGQQRQDQHKGHKEYEYFAEDETQEELARSLEIVVPRYI